ncbi:hypothetical protein M1349_04545 [Patescibacteria group bacterium]|nr:hypothetical protein [Patescibacteria group bacterium]
MVRVIMDLKSAEKLGQLMAHLNEYVIFPATKDDIVKALSEAPDVPKK